MPRSITMRRLRGLAVRYRSGVEGAADELRCLLDSRSDELSVLLHTSPQSIEQLRKEPSAVELLLAAVGRISDRRTVRSDARRCTATAMAACLLNDVDHRDGNIDVPVSALKRVLELWPRRGQLNFGERGGVDLAILRKLLRACDGLASTVVLQPGRLVVRYLTRRGSGVVRFALRPAEQSAAALYVPLRDTEISHRDAANEANGGSTALPGSWPADNNQDRSRMRPPSGPEHPLTQSAHHA